MSSPIDQLLAQLLGGQTVNPLAMGGGAPPQQYPGNFEGPAIQTGSAPAVQPPTMIRPEDLIASPNPSQPRTPDQRMEGFRRLLTDFNFSLGSGLAAASQNPRGRAQRTQAGMGAILQVPKILQDQIEAKKAAEEAKRLQTAQVLSGILNQQSEIQNRAAILSETERLRKIQESQQATEASDKAADNARLDKAAQAAEQNRLNTPISPTPIEDASGQYYAYPNPQGGPPILRKIEGVGPKPAAAGQPKSVQNDEYLLKDGTHTELSFDPTPTPQRPGGTYIDTKTQQDVTPQVVGKYRPPSATAGTTAETASYKYHSDKLLALAKPIDDAANRAQRLSDNLNLRTAQADTIIAPELLTVTSGGLGSGLRINEAEINRVSGGRPMVAQIQAKVRKWLGTDQKNAIDFAPEERKAIQDIVDIVNNKLTQKQQALSYFGDLNSQEGVKEQQRRAGLADLEKQLRAVDQGKILVPDPTGKLHIFDTPEQAAQFRKATGQ